jgi:hypothetical protein
MKIKWDLISIVLIVFTAAFAGGCMGSYLTLETLWQENIIKKYYPY